MAVVVLCAGPGLAGSRPQKAETKAETRADSKTVGKTDAKPAPAAPAPIIAKGRLFAVVLGPGSAGGRISSGWLIQQDKAQFGAVGKWIWRDGPRDPILTVIPAQAGTQSRQKFCSAL